MQVENPRTKISDSEYMVKGDSQFTVCTTDAQKKHMNAKDSYSNDWISYQEKYSGANVASLEKAVLILIASDLSTEGNKDRAHRLVLKLLKISPSKPELQSAYRRLHARGDIIKNCDNSRVVLKLDEQSRELISSSHRAALGVSGKELPTTDITTLGKCELELPLSHLTQFEKFYVAKSVRSNSGVVVITVVTAPGPFSCPEDCHYCPNEPGQPRSYLSTEPAVARANQNSFSAISQFLDRAITLGRQGHQVDKVEVIVLGGTWSGYPEEYQHRFCKEIFYAANIFRQEMIKDEYADHSNDDAEGKDVEKTPVATGGMHTYTPNRETPFVYRSRLMDALMSSRNPNYHEISSILEEQRINETAGCRIIGLTLETRPDHINSAELRRLRCLGCTRVQIGIQHTDDEILNVINRNCTFDQCVKAVRLLKENCFKVDIHLMPDLPSSSFEKDVDMFNLVLFGDLIQADHWKIYPCEVTPFSAIEKWYKDGAYIPYSEVTPDKLVDLLVYVKSRVPPWIRLNRVIRDIPEVSIIAGNRVTNLRQQVFRRLVEQNSACRCIRCREIRGWIDTNSRLHLVHRKYRSSQGDEYFISVEEKTHRGYGGGTENRGIRGLKQKPYKTSKRKKEHKKEVTMTYTSRVLQYFIVGSRKVPPLYTQSMAWFDYVLHHLMRTVVVFWKHLTCRSPYDVDYYSTPSLKTIDGYYDIESNKEDNHPLYGLLRLRLNDEGPSYINRIFPELSGCALIRELHVYGLVKRVKTKNVPTSITTSWNCSGSPRAVLSTGKDVQHSGIGKVLMGEAERVAHQKGFKRICVISGVGVRDYYRKLGYKMVEGTQISPTNPHGTYTACGQFLIKDLSGDDTEKRRSDRDNSIYSHPILTTGGILTVVGIAITAFKFYRVNR